MCETLSRLYTGPIRTLIGYICALPSSSSYPSSAPDVPVKREYGRYPGSGMRRYDSDVSNLNLREEDSGYVADSSSSSSECGEGEERPLLRRGLSWEPYAYETGFAAGSVETVILAGK